MIITEQETTQELRQNMVLIVSNLCHISSSPYSMSSDCISLTQSSEWDISLTQYTVPMITRIIKNIYLNARSEAGSEEGGVGWRPEHISMN